MLTAQHSVDEELALHLAERTAGLLRKLDDIERRLDRVNTAVRERLVAEVGRA
jgi:tetrahydromethanopterin S-methyltransferase subunit G